MSFTESIDELVAKSQDGRVAVHPEWKRVKLSQVATVLNGFPFSSESFNNEKGFPLIRIRDIVRSRTDTFYIGDFDKTYVVERGDLLIGMDGDFNCASWKGEPALLNQRVCKLIPDESKLDRRFLQYALPGYLNLINRHTSSLTVKHLSSGTIKDIPLPFPPLQSQKAIAGKIEELFSDLDAGVAALRRAQANLKRYRAAVLKAAVEGRLTAQWRAERKAKGIATEPAAQLLARILVERRKKWEAAQLRKYADAGKTPPKGWQGKYPEPAAPDVSGLAELPEGWGWVSLNQIVVQGPQNGLYLPSSAYGSGIPIMRIDDYQNLWSRPAAELRKVNASDSDVATYALNERDLLINRVNSLTHLGKVLRVGSQHIPAVFESNMMRMSVADCLCVDYVAFYLKSEQGRHGLTKNAKHAVNQASINQQDVLGALVPLPSIDEQTEIVAQAEATLSNIAQAEAEITRSLERAARLRQAILKRAFEGRLV